MIALCGVLLVLYLIIRWLEVHPGAASGLVVLLVQGCGGAIWATRHVANLVAWHALDHAWEIEDRIAPYLCVGSVDTGPRKPC